MVPGRITGGAEGHHGGRVVDQFHVEQHIVVVGGMGNVTFTLTSTPPPGLMLEPDGYLHGTPDTRGVFDVAVKATDSVTSMSRTIPLTVAEAGRLTLVAAILPPGAEDDFEYANEWDEPSKAKEHGGGGRRKAARKRKRKVTEVDLDKELKDLDLEDELDDDEEDEDED